MKPFNEMISQQKISLDYIAQVFFKIVFTILAAFLLCQPAVLWASQETADEIARISALPLSYLDKDELQTVVTKYIENHPEIDGLKIIESLTGEVYISIYRVGGQLKSISEAPDSLKDTKSFQSVASIAGETVGQVFLFASHKAASDLTLTEEERSFIETHPKITVGGEMDWAPFDFVDDAGNYSGITNDYLKIISQKLGIQMEMVTGPTWNELLRMLREKEIDALPAIYHSTEREDFVNFTSPYAKLTEYVFSRSSEATITSFEDLKDKTTVVVKGYTIETYLRKNHPDFALKTAPSIQEALKMLPTGEADAFIGDILSTAYNIKQLSLVGLKPTAQVPTKGPSVHMAIRKDWPVLRSLFDKALAAISQQEHNSIKQNWTGLAEQKLAEDKPRIQLSADEKTWLQAHPVIKVHNELNWPPYNFNIDGIAAGYSVDYMNLLGNRIGLEIQYVSGEWGELLNMAFEKKLDVMLNIVNTPERQKHLLYTKSYAKNPNVILSRKDSTISDIQSLFGKTVAFPKGFFYEELLKTQFPQIKRLPTKDTLDSLKKVQFGQADAALGELAVVGYLIKENLLTDLVVKGGFDSGNPEVEKLNIAVRNDWPELQSILTKAMNSVTTREISDLQEKWLGDAKEFIPLTQKEQAWIEQNSKIRLGIDPNWMPLEQLNKTAGTHEGIIADYLSIIAKRSGLKFEVIPTQSFVETIGKAKALETDVLSAVKKNEEREQFLNFSKAYFSLTDVIVMQQNSSAISGLRNLKEKRVGVVRSYWIEKRIQEDFPGIKVVPVNSTLEGLNQVTAGQLDAFVDDLFVVQHLIERNTLNNLKIAANTKYNSGLHLGIRKDWPEEVVSIINKAIDSIQPEEKNQIFNKWISIKEEAGPTLAQPGTDTFSPIEEVSLEDTIQQIVVQAVAFILIVSLLIGTIYFLMQRYLGDNIATLFQSNKATWFGAVLIGFFLLAVGIISANSLNRIEKRIRSDFASSLKTVVQSTHESLNVWLENQKRSIHLFAKNPQLVEFTQNLLDVSNNATQLKEHESQAKVRELLKANQQHYNLLDYFIMSPNYMTIASTKDKDIGSTSFLSQRYRSLFETVIRDKISAVLPMQLKAAPKASSQKDSPITSSLFFLSPITNDQGNVVAVLAMAVDPTVDISRITGVGRLGDSGETYAFDNSGILVSKSRFDDQLRQIGLIGPNETSIFKIRISDPGGNLLEGHQPSLSQQEQALTLMAAQALSVKKGVNNDGYRDYRGVRVFGAWLWESDLGIGITTEIDENEALETFDITRLIVVSVLGIAAFLSILLTAISLWLGKKANQYLLKQLAETKKIVSMTKTFQKFVPEQFLQRISTEGMEDIGLGNAETTSLTILFSDIRAFTTFSEKLSPKDLLDFLNSYFKKMNQSIHDNHGFIDKYIGDAIMALFDNPEGTEHEEALNAIQAAVAMQQSIQVFNQERQHQQIPPIEIGIGIHSGPVIVGTVGSEERLDSTVIGDTVNLASRLEGVTKLYGAGIIISAETFSLLKNEEQFQWRELDRIRVKGKKEPMGIFEIFDHDPPEVQGMKKKTAGLIMEGLIYRQIQDWDTAQKAFEEALTIHPDDKVAKQHIQHLQQLQLLQLSDDWDGAITLEQK
ncbi:MAG: transporter substrate-binding domain-containing protein [SAR324 cluster bacterium]|nr:transporter substrate-binding domain-containing protein [SAR324 cluster bacterium]